MSFTSFVHLFQMCKSEKGAGKMNILLSSAMDMVAFLTGVSKSILHLLQQGDPEPVQKCSP